MSDNPENARNPIKLSTNYNGYDTSWIGVFGEPTVKRIGERLESPMKQ